MKVIEFFGMPKAGKTTALEVMESYFKQKGARVRVVHEGARICPLDKSDRYFYHSWSFHNTVNRMLEARLDHYDFILVDRGVVDHLAFLRAIKDQCSGEQMQTSQNYYQMFLPLQDQEIFFSVDSDEAIRRESQYKPFVGRVFQKEFLDSLSLSYENTFSALASFGRNILRIDGNHLFRDNLHLTLDLAHTLYQELKGGDDKHDWTESAYQNTEKQ